jgi:hypothetical protein
MKLMNVEAVEEMNERGMLTAEEYRALMSIRATDRYHSIAFPNYTIDLLSPEGRQFLRDTYDRYIGQRTED